MMRRSRPVVEPRHWTAQQLAEALDIPVKRHFEATNISIDSRTIRPGDVFVALKGERFDGHAFVQTALEAGAVAAIVSDPVEGADDSRLVPVADTLEALRQLGAFARVHTPARYIAVTGSVGKTSTKEQLKLAFSALDETYATAGNFNNHIGMPLSLARMPATTRFGVFEMGMNHAGEISPLSTLVKPDVAIVTTVEPAHLEHFTSERHIADAKAEIFDGLNGGTAIINLDNRHGGYLMEKARARAISRILTVGTRKECDVRLLSAELSNTGQDIEAEVGGIVHRYRIQSIARHQAFNTLFTLAAAHALGCNVSQVAEGLGSFADPAGRGRLHRLMLNGYAVTVMDDSYNASPASMKAAIETAGAIVRRQGKGRLIAVLGDMLELGAEEAGLHASLAPVLEEQRAAVLIAAGPRMHALTNIVKLPEVIHMDTAAEVEQSLLPRLKKDDVILIKGSHGSHMYRVAEVLLKPDAGKTNSNTMKVVA